MTIRHFILAFSAFCLAGGGAALAQNATWSVGQHARVFYPRPGGIGPGWRSGVITEVYSWGAHMRFDDEDRVETFGNSDLKSLDGSPNQGDAAPAPRADPPAAPNRGGGAAAPNPAYIAGAGAGVRFPGQAGPSAPAARLVTNSYYCIAFIGTPPSGHMATMPGFTLLAGGRYRHQDGSTGTVTASGGTLLFHGGALDGRAARYDSGATGRGTVHLYNDSRSRTVIDCDGHG